MLTLVIFIILVALVFDFLNGFHDSANSIATIVSTRVLTPRKAVVWAAFFNLVAAFLFDVRVAKTIGAGLVKLESVNEYVILCGLIGAIVWNLITWYTAFPQARRTRSWAAMPGRPLCTRVSARSFTAVGR